MKPRRDHRYNHSIEFEPVNEVFEQPEKSLLGEALSRPLGLVAVVLLVSSIIVFGTNHFILAMDRVNDFAMVSFFVAGGILLSMLLRSGEPAQSIEVRPNPRAATAAHHQDIAFDDRGFDDRGFDDRGFDDRGFDDRGFDNRSLDDREGLSLVVDDEIEFGGQRGKVRKSRSNFKEAQPISSESGAPIPAGATRDVVETEQDDEVAGYERALLHYAERGDLHGQGEILRRLGHTAKSRGHLNESREFYMNSRNFFKETSDHYAEAAVLLDLGQVLESLGDQDGASAAYRDANRALLDVAMNSTNEGGAYNAQAAD